MTCFARQVPYTYTSARAEWQGMTSTDASRLVIYICVGNVGSRIVMGILADRFRGLSFGLYVAVSTLLGAVSVTLAMSTSHIYTIVYSILFGMLVGQLSILIIISSFCYSFFYSIPGSYLCLFPLTAVELFGADRPTRCIGQCLAAGAIPFLVASPFSGTYNQDS